MPQDRLGRRRERGLVPRECAGDLVTNRYLHFSSELENLLEQLKNGVRSMRMPVDTLESNWAYMVMASLAWSLKSWVGLLLPTGGRWASRRFEEKSAVMRMEFKRFCHYFVHIPCQIIQSGRRVVYRILGWNRYLPVLLRAFESIGRPLRC